MFVKNISTGENIKASISKLSLQELKSLKAFQFDWNLEIEFDLYKLEIQKSGQILGLISLDKIFKELRIEIRLLEISKSNIGAGKTFDRIAGNLIAFACKESFQCGFYGFVSLTPKTSLIEHYETKYGFNKFANQMYLELTSSELLMNKYLLYEK